MTTRLSFWTGLLMLTFLFSMALPTLTSRADDITQQPVPPLDLKAPDKFETATFGLG